MKDDEMEECGSKPAAIKEKRNKNPKKSDKIILTAIHTAVP